MRGADRKPHFLVHESKRVGFLVIEAWGDHLRGNHLIEEALHPFIRHGADPEHARIAGIDNSVLLQFRHGERQLAVRHLGIVLFDAGICFPIVAIHVAVPPDDRGIDKALHEIRLLRNKIGASFDRGRVAIVAVFGQEKDVWLKAALPLDFIGLRGDITLLDGILVGNERRRIKIVGLHLLFAKPIRVLQPLENRDQIVFADKGRGFGKVVEAIETDARMRHQDQRIFLEQACNDQRRDALLDRKQRLDQVGAEVEVDAPRCEQELVVHLRAPLDDLHVEAVALVGPVNERLVEPTMLGLGKPIGCERHSVQGVGEGGTTDQQGGGEQRTGIFHARIVSVLPGLVKHEAALRLPLRPVPPRLSPMLASRLWADLTTTDMRAADMARVIAVLPFAAIEQHGPHLPLGTDLMIMEGYLARVHERLAPDLRILFLPVQAIGASPEHSAFAGTLSLPDAAALGAWAAIGESVARSGCRKLVLLNSHGGNSALVDRLALDLRVRLRMFAVTASWARFGYPDGLFSQKEITHGIHGGEIETSLMLAFRPDLVRMGEASDFKPASLDLERDFAWLRLSRPAGFGWMAQDLSSSGAAGNAAAASAQKGEAAADYGVTAFIELLQDIDAFDLARLDDGPG